MSLSNVAMFYDNGTQWIPVETKIQYDPTAPEALKFLTSKLGFFSATPQAQPSGAEHEALDFSALGTPSGVVLELLHSAEGAWYLSTVGAAVTLAASGAPPAPGVYSSIFGAGAASTQSDVEGFTHASPGALTYTRTYSHDVHFVVAGSVLLADAAERVQVGVNVLRSGVNTVIPASLCLLETGSANDCATFAMLFEYAAQLGDVYTLVAATQAGTTQSLTTLSCSVHAYVSPSVDAINTNLAKIAELVNALRSTLVTLGLDKGGA